MTFAARTKDDARTAFRPKLKWPSLSSHTHNFFTTLLIDISNENNAGKIHLPVFDTLNKTYPHIFEQWFNLDCYFFDQRIKTGIFRTLDGKRSLFVKRWNLNFRCSCDKKCFIIITCLYTYYHFIIAFF